MELYHWYPVRFCFKKPESYSYWRIINVLKMASKEALKTDLLRKEMRVFKGSQEK